MPKFSPLQKGLAVSLALLVLFLGVVVVNGSGSTIKYEVEKEFLVASHSFQNVPNLPAGSGHISKVNLVLYTFASLWSLFLLLKALEIQQNQTLLQPFFLRKINFVFVSTQAP